MFNGLPFQILQKYDFTLPRFTDENYNKLLKIVASYANVPSLVSQTARHTFLTNIARSTNNVYKVMKYGGIVSTETASIYMQMAKKYLGKVKINNVWSDNLKNNLED